MIIKHIFNLKRSTPTFVIYGELGVTPLSVEIKTRAISFWSKIVSGHAQPTRLSCQTYMVLYNMHKSNKYKSAYIENIENILNICGLSGMALASSHKSKMANVCYKQKLKDLQNWYSLATGTILVTD